ARATEVYATYYDVKYPGQERTAGRPLRLSPTYPRLGGLGRAVRAHAAPGRVVRREGRLGAPELVRGQRRTRRRRSSVARLGRPDLVASDRRRAPRLPGARRAVRRDLVRQARGRRPGRLRVPRAAVREPRRPAGGQ